MRSGCATARTSRPADRPSRYRPCRPAATAPIRRTVRRGARSPRPEPIHRRGSRTSPIRDQTPSDRNGRSPSPNRLRQRQRPNTNPTPRCRPNVRFDRAANSSRGGPESRPRPSARAGPNGQMRRVPNVARGQERRSFAQPHAPDRRRSSVVSQPRGLLRRRQTVSAHESFSYGRQQSQQLWLSSSCPPLVQKQRRLS